MIEIPGLKLQYNLQHSFFKRDFDNPEFIAQNTVEKFFKG